jgi:hypothetical protein
MIGDGDDSLRVFSLRVVAEFTSQQATEYNVRKPHVLLPDGFGMEVAVNITVRIRR